MKGKSTIKKNVKKDTKLIIQEVTDRLFKLLEVEAGLEILEDEETDSYTIKVDAPNEAGLLIGNRGKTMLDLQMIIGMIVKRKTDEWHRIIVNVGDWREKENRKLEELADQAAQRAKETGEVQFLYNLNPSQRRTIHLYLSGFKDVDTKSEGEGDGRYLIVSSK